MTRRPLTAFCPIRNAPVHSQETHEWKKLITRYDEIVEGVWYPLGGMHSVVAALEAIAIEHGSHFRFGADGNVKVELNSICFVPLFTLLTTGLQEIVVDEQTNKTLGVRLQDGSFVQADAVICNVDAPWAYNNLLPSTPYGKKMDNLEYTSSTISFYW